MNELKSAALRYAANDWRVLPLHYLVNGRCSCNRACKQPAKHPLEKCVPHGLHDATTDAETIEEWWDRFPQANIGIRTGAISNLWVLDVDAKRSVSMGNGTLVPEGENTIRTLEARSGEELPETLTSLTGGGGKHYLFTYPDQAGKYTNRVHVAPSIDVRGENGYFVAPPSVHASGNRYVWANEGEPVAKPPMWLLTFQEERSSDSFTEQDEVGEGGRNDYLFKYACKLRGEGREGDELASLVMGHNYLVCNPPLEKHEVLRIIKNASAYEPNPPEAEFVWGDGGDVPELEDGDDVAISIRDLMLNPPPPMVPIIEGGIMDEGDGFILGGVSNVGKSWLAFDMGLSIAMGTPWLGKFPTTRKSVLYIDEEASASSNYERLQMILRGMGMDGTEEDIPFYIAIQKGIKLDSPKGMATIARLLERYKPGVVMFDAMVRFHSGDENSTRDMANFFDQSRQLKNAYNSAFVFLHHVRKPSKEDAGDVADQLRGSSDIRGWPDSVLILKENDRKDGVIVHHAKSRNHRKLEPFEVGRVIDENDRTARFAYRGDLAIDAGTPSGRREAIVRVIEKLQEKAPPDAAMIAGRTGMAERTVVEHLDVLVAEGRIVCFTTGPGARRAYIIASTPLVQAEIK